VGADGGVAGVGGCGCAGSCVRGDVRALCRAKSTVAVEANFVVHAQVVVGLFAMQAREPVHKVAPAQLS